MKLCASFYHTNQRLVLLILSGGCLPETDQGAAWEGQTHLRQHVSEIRREGFEGERFVSHQHVGGRVVLHIYIYTSCVILFFPLLSRKKRWRRPPRVKKTAMIKWSLRTGSVSDIRCRYDCVAVCVFQTSVTWAFCVDIVCVCVWTESVFREWKSPQRHRPGCVFPWHFVCGALAVEHVGTKLEGGTQLPAKLFWW